MERVRSLIRRATGFTTGLAVSGGVWRDLDSDGRRDAGEAPIKGVVVKLVDDNGNVVGSTTTGALS